MSLPNKEAYENYMIDYIKRYHLVIRDLDEKQVAKVLLEVIESGDLIKLVTYDGKSQNFIYVPYKGYDELRSKYNELIYAVAQKYPDENRHETALRYIKEREENKETGESKSESESV